MKQFRNLYLGKRVLVTGHTGFKGSWLCMWLKELGAKVTGISLAPETLPNHWTLLRLDSIIDDFRLDIRDANDVAKIFEDTQPEIVFHLAAQPLVRRSYQNPLETWSTNVMGTANVLEACRKTRSVQGIVVVTSDKCYENREWIWGYRENDQLGGHDPYSASKAGSEFVAASYRSAFFGSEGLPLLATARAGNVIGGGDWSDDRLIPDFVRAIISKRPLEIRLPNATRPWQHVLEPLCGYLLLGQNMLLGDRQFEGSWNFGPEYTGNRTVSEVVDILSNSWGNIQWHKTITAEPHEANLLFLDTTKAFTQLGWKSLWGFETTLKKTVEWYRAFIEQDAVISHQQLFDFIQDARDARVSWIET